MTNRIIKGLLISSSLGLSACTVNSSHYSIRVDEWITDVTLENVVLQYRAVPKYDYHFIWLGMREIDYLKQLDYRTVNKNKNHVCVQVDVNGKGYISGAYSKQNIVRDVTLVAPNEIKDMGYFMLTRSSDHEWESDFSVFEAYQDGDKFTCEKPEDDINCYITTAMCRDTGKPDDCAELQSLRKYRDEVMLHDLEGKRLVKEYYVTAPKIVSLINQEPDHYEIYRALRENYITPAAQAADAGNNAQALELYKTMVEALLEKYKNRI